MIVKNNKLIITNFLNQNAFNSIKELLLDETVPWLYNSGVNMPNAADYQFVHGIWSASASAIPTSLDIWNSMSPILTYLEPSVLLKIKANLRTKTNKIEESDYHCDIVIPGSLTAIFYINTCDGYTKFKDGDKIKSVENTLIVFPSNLHHLGTTCTDEKRRVLININFIPNLKSKLASMVYSDVDKTYITQWIEKCEY
jgi:hypothetical protein